MIIITVRCPHCQQTIEVLITEKLRIGPLEIEPASVAPRHYSLQEFFDLFVDNDSVYHAMELETKLSTLKTVLQRITDHL